MNTTSTQYLLKHLYGETEPTEKIAIEDALAVNHYLKDAYQSWQQMHEMMQQTQFSPDDKTIQFLLRYSATKRELIA